MHCSWSFSRISRLNQVLNRGVERLRVLIVLYHIREERNVLREDCVVLTTLHTEPVVHYFTADCEPSDGDDACLRESSHTDLSHLLVEGTASVNDNVHLIAEVLGSEGRWDDIDVEGDTSQK